MCDIKSFTKIYPLKHSLALECVSLECVSIESTILEVKKSRSLVVAPNQNLFSNIDTTQDTADDLMNKIRIPFNKKGKQYEKISHHVVDGRVIHLFCNDAVINIFANMTRYTKKLMLTIQQVDTCHYHL